MTGPEATHRGPVGRIEPTSPDVPTRVIVRIACNFLLALEADGVRRFGSIQRAIIFSAIVAANVQHITRSAVRTWRYAGVEQIPPDSERRPVSILGLSQWVGRPFETTRAHVGALVREGLCVKTPKGVFVPTDVLLSERIVASEAFLWNEFNAMVADLRSIDFDFGIVIGAGDSSLVVEEDFKPQATMVLPRRVITRVISEFYIRAIVGAIAPHGDDFNTGAIFATYMILNSSAFNLKADIAWRYSTADATPPDELRRPASVAEVADRLCLGHELVRRKTRDLVAAGRLERQGKGFLVSMDHMQGPNSRAGGAAIVNAFYRMIYDLTALGVRL